MDPFFKTKRWAKIVNQVIPNNNASMLHFTRQINIISCLTKKTRAFLFRCVRNDFHFPGKTKSVRSPSLCALCCIFYSSVCEVVFSYKIPQIKVISARFTRQKFSELCVENRQVVPRLHRKHHHENIIFLPLQFSVKLVDIKILLYWWHGEDNIYCRSFDLLGC